MNVQSLYYIFSVITAQEWRCTEDSVSVFTHLQVQISYALQVSAQQNKYLSLTGKQEKSLYLTGCFNLASVDLFCLVKVIKNKDSKKKNEIQVY